MTDQEIKQFEELRERLGDSLINCETDQLRHWTQAIYQDSEWLVAEVKAMRAYLQFINEYCDYVEFRHRFVGNGKAKKIR